MAMEATATEVVAAAVKDSWEVEEGSFRRRRHIWRTKRDSRSHWRRRRADGSGAGEGVLGVGMRGAVLEVEGVRTVDDSAGLKVVKTVGQMVGASGRGDQAVGGRRSSSVVAIPALKGGGVWRWGGAGGGRGGGLGGGHGGGAGGGGDDDGGIGGDGDGGGRVGSPTLLVALKEVGTVAQMVAIGKGAVATARWGRG